MDKRIVNIKFKISTNKDIIEVPELNQMIETLIEQMDPEEKYVIYFKINILAELLSGKTSEIGFIEGYFFEAEMFLSEANSFFDLCDRISGDICGMAEAVTTKKGNIKSSICPPENNIMYIDKMYIEERYRNCGVGTYMIDNINALLRYSLNLEAYVCVLMPYPQVKSPDGELTHATEDTEEKRFRLIRFYRRTGFSEIKGTQYMFRHLF